jgi:hypothetical protein
MLYRFAPFFYKTSPSACAPTGPGLDLSDGDKRGLALLYPSFADDSVSELAERSQRGLEIVGTEAPGETRSIYTDRLIEQLEAHSTVGG